MKKRRVEIRVTTFSKAQRAQEACASGGWAQEAALWSCRVGV